jgi:hypothetical protein
VSIDYRYAIMHDRFVAVDGAWRRWAASTYDIKQGGPEDQFIFFYAGHGFYATGSNRLTTWDTHTLNITETTVCLEKALFSPLNDCGGRVQVFGDRGPVSAHSRWQRKTTKEGGVSAQQLIVHRTPTPPLRRSFTPPYLPAPA